MREQHAGAIKTFMLIMLLLLAQTIWCAPARAHRLNVFAWLENSSIIVECNFGKDRPAAGAAVQILDQENKKELARGKTDATGHFVFTVPQVVRDGHGLIVDVNAGEGHHNEWLMDASELYSAASLTAGFDAAALDAAAQGKQASGSAAPDHVHIQATPNIPLPAASAGISTEQLKNTINEVLESKLGPIRHELAAKNVSGPSFAEIIGGIGWIMGMIGIILYFKSRRKPQ